MSMIYPRCRLSVSSFSRRIRYVGAVPRRRRGIAIDAECRLAGAQKPQRRRIAVSYSGGELPRDNRHKTFSIDVIFLLLLLLPAFRNMIFFLLRCCWCVVRLVILLES